MQTGGAQVVGNDFGGGYLPLPLLNSSVLWKHCWNWWDPGQGVQVGKGAVLGAPDRAGKEEQDPSLRYSIRSFRRKQLGDHGIPEQEEQLCYHREILFGGEGGLEEMKWRSGSLGQHRITW